MSNKRHSELGTQRWKNLRKRIIDRDVSCVVCGAVDELQVDHIVPRSKSTEEDVYNPENLQTMCKRCNLVKGAKTMRVFSAQSSTPPAFTEVSLSEMSTFRPESPFDDPDMPDCV